jgi:hypothetical protein
MLAEIHERASWFAVNKTNQSPAKCMHLISNSAKVFIKKIAPSALVALLGAGAIYLIASNGSTRTTMVSPQASVAAPTAPVKNDPQVAPAGDSDKPVLTPSSVGQDANEANNQAIAEDNSAISQASAPPVTPAPTPAVGGNTFTMDSEFLKRQQPEVERKSLPRSPKEAERKSLERKREQAERKRARLEEMYQKHLISNEAYRKGEEKYKSEIEKYRSAVNAGRVPKSPMPTA